MRTLPAFQVAMLLLAAACGSDDGTDPDETDDRIGVYELDPAATIVCGDGDMQIDVTRFEVISESETELLIAITASATHPTLGVVEEESVFATTFDAGTGHFTHTDDILLSASGPNGLFDLQVSVLIDGTFDEETHFDALIQGEGDLDMVANEAFVHHNCSIAVYVSGERE